MNNKECETLIAEHCRRFPKVREYLFDHFDGDERRLDWHESLKQFSLARIEQASRSMYEGHEPKPFGAEGHLACLRVHANAISVSEGVKYYSGERGYKCKLCECDSGYVLVWNPRFVKYLRDTYLDENYSIPKDWKTRESYQTWRRTSRPKFVGMETCSVVCTCTEGTPKHDGAVQRGYPKYNEDRFCIYRHGDLENLTAWADNNSGRYSEFDDFNQGAFR